MRILRPEPHEARGSQRSAAVGHAAAGLHCRVRLADGRVFAGDLPAVRHRGLQLGMLHAGTAELVELTPGTRPPDGRLELDRRRHRAHYLRGGGDGEPGWLAALLEHAERIASGEYATGRHPGGREEAFVGVAPRICPRGDKLAVEHTRFLWVDVDRPGQLDGLWSFLAQRPCHMLVESGGSGGVHAYWRLDAPLPATRVDRATGEVVEPIEQAHLRLIHHLGVDADGKPTVADVACKERSRVMRLAGTINWKSGRHARVAEADFQLPPYPVATLVGDLPDPPHQAPDRRARRAGSHADPYKRIAPPVYFERLAAIAVPHGGLVSCPSPRHDDRHPSCSVGVDADQGWCCHSGSCGARGAIYDLASVVEGGPWGRELRGEAFARARARVNEAFGDLG